MTARYSVENPHPFYARLCAAGPVHRLSLGNGATGWLVTRYAQARAVLSDPRLSRQPPSPDHTSRTATARTATAGPASSYLGSRGELRKLMAAAFAPRWIEATLRPHIERITNELLDAMAGRGHADLVEDFAFPLANRVTCELLGVPRADQDDFCAWAKAVISRDEAGSVAVLTQLEEYLAELVTAKRRSPGEDIVSALIAVGDSGRALSDEELVWMAFLPVAAGYDTVPSLIGNGMLALFNNPAQLDLLRADPALISSGVNELLRHTGTIERSKPRYATEDLQVGSVTIRRGELVLVALSAANRDPRKFSASDTLDVRRAEGGHLTFGYGLHYCPGARVARFEIETAIGSLIRRFDDLRLAVAPQDLPWHRTQEVRTLSRLPVRFTRDPRFER